MAEMYEIGEVDQLNHLGDALAGERGEGQQRIARTGLAWIIQLLNKNADYGSSVWKEPVLCPGLSADTAIRVRLSDKIERLRKLFSGGKAQVKDETLEDTVGDLGAYCLLWLARPGEPTAAPLTANC